MTFRATAAIGALILAASAAPAVAGGYWDGGIVQSGPAYGAAQDQQWNCPCNCPPVREDRFGGGWRDERGWSEDQGDQRYYQSRSIQEDTDQQDYDQQDYDRTPQDYSDYGVGPGYAVEESAGGGGGGGEGFGFAGAGAFAGANASADVDVDVDIRDRDHRGHDMMHHMPYPPRMMQPYPHQPYPPQHMGGWGPMPGNHPMQPHYGPSGRPMMHGGGYRRR